MLLALVCVRPVLPVMMHRELYFVSGSLPVALITAPILLLESSQRDANLTLASIVGRPRHHG